MKVPNTKFLSVALLVFAAVVPAMAQTPVDKEAFDITLPAGFAEFTKQVQKAESPDGTVETTNWISRAQTGEAVVVTMSKMPGKILDPEKMMNATRDSLLKSLKATVESEQALPGEKKSTMIQFRSDAAVLQSQLLVDEDRLFQVLYVGRTPEQRSAPAVAQLFSSFKPAEAPKVAEAPTATAQQ